MVEVLLFLVPVALLSVLFALGMGLRAFTQNGDAARRQSNIWMRWRIGLQFAAVALIVLLVALAGG